MMTTLNMIGDEVLHRIDFGLEDQDFAEALGTDTSDKPLEFYGGEISLERAKAFRTGLEQNSTLTTLFIGRNNLKDQGANILAQSLIKNTTLTHLSLTDNNITRVGAKAIAFALTVNFVLRELDLKENLIDDDGAKEMAKMLGRNTTLQSLVLNHNNITSEGAVALAKSLETNNTLKKLKIQPNGTATDTAEKVLAFENTLSKFNKNLTTLDFIPPIMRLTNDTIDAKIALMLTANTRIMAKIPANVFEESRDAQKTHAFKNLLKILIQFENKNKNSQIGIIALSMMDNRDAKITLLDSTTCAKKVLRFKATMSAMASSSDPEPSSDKKSKCSLQ